MSVSFWKKWEKANELEAIRLVRTLPGFDSHQKASLLNSYLTDMYHCLVVK